MMVDLGGEKAPLTMRNRNGYRTCSVLMIYPYGTP